MAKSGPDTATSQWFVNLGDNSDLDDPNRPDGGFAAFGRVLGDGMTVVDAIAALPWINAGSPFDTLPVIDFQGETIYKENLVIVHSVTDLNLLDGDYDFEFTLYDSPILGSVVAGPVPVPDWPVSDGLFTVSVDFGDDAFTGDARWLRIGGYWYPRGGIPIDVFWETGAKPGGLWIPDQGVATYRGRG